jgi:gliding motility-associated-like protein
MKKRFLVLILFLAAARLQAQECPVINFPAPGSDEIPVDATIRWPDVSGIIGYSLTLGTFPGGEDILSRRSAGLTNFFTPPVGLPENTRVYVTISMFLGDGRFIFCTEEMFFDTVNVTTPPNCTSLDSPRAGDINVDNEGAIGWNYAPTATGYHLTIGSIPGGRDILDNADVGNRITYKPPLNLPPDSDIYVLIIPYNENGAATGCNEERFTTGSGTINCGPYRDPVSGETVRLGPEIDFPGQIGVCLDLLPTRVNATSVADGYRWSRINSDNSETLLSETDEVFLSEVGLYRYLAYNEVEQNGIIYECAESRIFTVIASELPTITGIDREDMANGSDLTVEVAGTGSYEYALDDPEGPYQDSPVFTSVDMGVHTVYVRDRNGCGVREEVISLGIPEEGFPKFFTPNGDGINDYWQFDPMAMHSEIRLQHIFIFDRYGVLLAQISPESRGWDGRMNGKMLPASNYWFRAKDAFNNELTGYFVLKR